MSLSKDNMLYCLEILWISKHLLRQDGFLKGSDHRLFVQLLIRLDTTHDGLFTSCQTEEELCKAYCRDNGHIPNRDFLIRGY